MSAALMAGVVAAPGGGRADGGIAPSRTSSGLRTSVVAANSQGLKPVSGRAAQLSQTRAASEGLTGADRTSPTILRAAHETVWTLDNLERIGGFATEVEGAPKIVAGPVGKALQFDGERDSVFVNGRPLIGAATFTIEAIVRPDGGPFQQRFMHVAETDPLTGLDANPTGASDPNPRFMFEVRVKDGQWALDAFVNSKAGSRPLLFFDKMHPLNRWYAVAQTYDGKTYRAYVDGVLQGEGDVAFTPHGPGHVRIGARMNKIDYFQGAIATLRFTDRALDPTEFLQVPRP